MVNGNNNHEDSTDEDSNNVQTVAQPVHDPVQQSKQKQQNVTRTRRAVSEDIRNTHPNHEDEVILRRKLREEKGLFTFLMTFVYVDIFDLQRSMTKPP